MKQDLGRWVRMSRALRMAVAAISLTGCTAHRTFHFGSPALDASYQSMKAKAPPEGRAIIERLEEDETALAHVIDGVVDPAESRGTKTNFASSKKARAQCRMRHPAFYGIDPLRNFDLFYDEEVAKLPYPFPNPVDALLYHEIVGHIVPELMDPSWGNHPEEETERYAIERENEYRQHVGMRLVPIRKRVPPPVKEKP